MSQGVAPTNRESTFHLEELFFSTTDRKGFITFGNNVFVRVSKYANEELIGEPHNTVRHPDMPHCIFQLFWDYLQKGKSVAAYVKNKAKDGSYYWVLAYVAPIPEGYLSIRLKPTGPLFERVVKIYQELRIIEQKADEAGLSRAKSMEAGAERLQAILASLNFENYDRLMDEMVISEVLSRKAILKREQTFEVDTVDGFDDLSIRRQRCAQLTRRVQRLQQTQRSFLDLEKTLSESIHFAYTFGNTIRRLTLNSRILASALGKEAASLSEVARQLNVISVEVGNAGEQLGKAMSNVMARMKNAAAQIASSDLSVEMMSSFLKELQSDNTDSEAMSHNIDNLTSVINDRMQMTFESTEAAAGELATFEKALERFMESMQTLDMLYVSGRIESVRCSGADDFSEVLCEMVSAAGEARTRTDTLNSLASKVQAQLNQELASQRNASRAA